MSRRRQEFQCTSKAFVEFCESMNVTHRSAYRVEHEQGGIPIRQRADGEIFQHAEEWLHQSAWIPDWRWIMRDGWRIRIYDVQPRTPTQLQRISYSVWGKVQISGGGKCIEKNAELSATSVTKMLDHYKILLKTIRKSMRIIIMTPFLLETILYVLIHI